MRRAVLYAALAASLAACAGAKSQDDGKVSLSFQAQLDSGNAAYRRHDYKRANKFYHAAAKSDPDNVSGWYGIYMAESKLGNMAAADEAKAVVAKQAPAMPLTEHPTAADTQAAPANPHVPQPGAGHPALPLDSTVKEQP